MKSLRAVIALLAAGVVMGNEVNIADRAVATLKIPGHPDFLAADGDAVWITGRGRLDKFRHTSNKPIVSVLRPGLCGIPVVAFHDLWIANCKDLAVDRIDRQTGAIKAVIRTGLADPTGGMSITAGDGSFWVLSDADGVLSRIEPRRNRVVATIKVAANSYAARFGFHSIWVTSTTQPGLLQRIDPTSNSVAQAIRVGPKPHLLAPREGSVWVLNQGNGTVSRVNPASNRVVATIAVNESEEGADIDAGGGRVWVRGTKGSLSEIDLNTNEVVTHYSTAVGSGSVRVTGNGVWVTANDINTAWVLPPVDAASVKQVNMEDRALATLRVPGLPDFMVADGDAVWINVTSASTLQKFRHTSEKPIVIAKTPDPCGIPVIAFDDLWTADCKDLAVYRIDRETGAVKTIIHSGIADSAGEMSIAAGADSIWILSDKSGVLSRIDPRQNRVVATIKVAPDSYSARFGFDSVWTTSTAVPGLVQRIDPASNTVTQTIPVGPKPRFFAVGEHGVWTLNQADGTVSRVDPETNRLIATIAAGLPRAGGGIEAGGGRVWVRGQRVGLTEIDPRSNEILTRYHITAGSGYVSIAGDRVWITTDNPDTADSVWILPVVHQ